MNSKMVSWLKKRCRRRPEDNLQNPEETKLPRYTYPPSDSPLYFRVSMSPFRKTREREAPLYDDVYDERTLQEPSKNQKMDSEIHHRICPLCRSEILTDHSCKCVILRRNLRSQKPKTRHEVSLDSLLQISNEDDHCHSSDDDSSGFYESVGSDSMSSGDLNSDSGVTTDSDDGYEAVEFNPCLGHKRQYSVGSLHTLLQRTKLQNSRVIDSKEKPQAFQRTTTRRSLMVVSLSTKL